MKKNHFVHAATVVVASLIFVPMLLIADPTLDASSSAEAFIQSATRVANSVKDDPNIGFQEKVRLVSFLTTEVAAEAMRVSLEQLNKNPNATANQNGAIFLSRYKQYDGMTAAQLLAKFRAIDAANEAKARKQDVNSIINDWLEGRDNIPLGFPNKDKFESYLQGDKLAVHIRGGQFLTIKLNESRTGVSSEKGAYKLINKSDYQSAIIPFDGEEMNSLDQFNWFFPKFKEWANKIKALPDEEKPALVIKRFTSAQIDKSPDGSDAPPIVWYTYRKGIGSGVFVFDRKLDQEAIKNGLRGADLPSNVLDRKLTSLPPDGAYPDTPGLWHYSIGELKLASDIPRVLDEWLKWREDEVKKEQAAKAKANDDAAKQRDAVKKLNLE